jgi:hypothetical protein
MIVNVSQFWRTFVINCRMLQGTVHDIGPLCGGCLTNASVLAHASEAESCTLLVVAS